MGGQRPDAGAGRQIFLQLKVDHHLVRVDHQAVLRNAGEQDPEHIRKKTFLSTNDDVSRRLHESWSFSQLTWGEHAKSPKARLELEISALRGAVLEKVLCLAEAGRDQKKIIHHSHQSSGRDRGGEKNDQLQHAALS